MKRRILLIVTLFVLSLSAVACASQSEQSVADESFTGGAAPAARPEMEMVVVEESTAYDMSTENQSPPGQQRLIIRTAQMSIVATDTEETMDAIAAMANNSGGWVVSSEVYQSGGDAKTGYIQIRIPSEGFQSVLDAIAGLAVEVNNISTSGQDVTEEFVDLDARLGNLEATAARLRTFLDESRNVEEALAVNIELSRVEGEIESLKGRIQFLQQSAAFSSINVNITPDELAQPIQVAGWQPGGIAKQAIEALVNTLQVLAQAAIWLVLYALPVLLIIAIPFVLLLWVIRRLRRRERAAEVSETASTLPSE